MSSAHRIPQDKFQDPTSIREAWIKDFYRLRHSPAHGRRDIRYPSVWPLREHLLLGSFAFPLVVKVMLHQEGLYALSDEDRLGIDMFEHLASEDAFAHFDAPEDQSPEAAWHRIRLRFLA